MQPRAVQAQVVPAVLEGRDVVALAETGSGKTLAYLAPVMQQILDDRPAKGRRLTARQRLRAVVICPTRELVRSGGHHRRASDSRHGASKRCGGRQYADVAPSRVALSGH